MAPIQLSPSTFLYPPSTEEEDTNGGAGGSKKSDPSHPRAVVLATWAFAQDAHIAKYVGQYRQRFPGASVLVAKCFLRHFFWLPAAREDLDALAVAIRNVVADDDKGDDEPGASNNDAGGGGGGHHGKAERAKIILHIFSNSGLSTAYQLRNVYEADGRTPFPQRVTIYDSTPGRYEYWSITSSLQFGIPPGRWLQKLVSFPLAHLLSSSLWVWCRVLKGEDWVAKWAAAANSSDPRGQGGGQRETCRSYAYSRADPLVESWVVEAHAADARARGFTVVHAADFGEGSAHVAHSRADPERYWRLVMDTWETARLARL
ncbi:hypothetical protein N3K66_004121 [Trichothecium roseum]|uniref:Uncharacterized protein n=1 Tax=Trichothecium roseum TaxID=47278 RepID=A0ACC0V0B7_9HYPO|nr:hypothetical protein N3K66_004121 [Trichothecium roseum]